MGGFRVHSSVEPWNWQCLTNNQVCMLQNIYNWRKCGYLIAADINKTGSLEEVQLVVPGGVGEKYCELIKIKIHCINV